MPAFLVYYNCILEKLLKRVAERFLRMENNTTPIITTFREGGGGRFGFGQLWASNPIVFGTILFFISISVFYAQATLAQPSEATSQRHCADDINYSYNSETNKCLPKSSEDPNLPPTSIVLCPSGYSFSQHQGQNTCVLDYIANNGFSTAAKTQDDYLKSTIIPTSGAEESFSCTSVPGFLSNIGSCIFWGIGSFFLKLLSWILMLSGGLLDAAIDFNLNIAVYLNNTSGIMSVWSVVRDLANILFIFFLLWISIETILGLDDAKKYLARIIIAAVLINFSMFFSRVIIDTSNIVALQFYSGITTSSATGTTDTVGTSVLRSLRMQTLYGSESLTGKSPPGWSLVVIVILASIFLLIAIYAFLNAAFMFIARVLVLVILVATSPIAVVQSILPEKMRKFHTMWWNNMWEQALVAPVFMLMLWIVIAVASSLAPAQLSGSGSILDSIRPDGGGGVGMAPVFNFLLLIGLLIATVKITKALSGEAGSMMTNFGGSVLGGAIGGVGGWALRGTVGRGLAAASQNEKFQKWSQQNFATRALHKATLKGAEASYDVRAGVPLVGGVAGNILNKAGMSIDTGKSSGKGGFKAFEKEATKTDVDYAKELKPEAQKGFVGSLENTGMLGRFVSMRTKKSVNDATRTIKRQLDTKQKEEEDEARLEMLNNRYKDDVISRATTDEPSDEVKKLIEELDRTTKKDWSIADIVNNANKETSAVRAQIEEDYEKTLDIERSRLEIELDIAKRELIDADREVAVGNLLKQLSENNDKIRKVAERERLQRLDETRRNRREDSNKPAPVAQAPAPGGGS